jgi:hypothetical protein
MGLYSRLEVPRLEPCENCGDAGLFTLQFHYGAARLEIHAVGSPIQWGSNDQGSRGSLHVEVLADAERCTVCGFVEERMYVVVIDYDIISGYRLAGEAELANLEW